jgi:hypothetical protein
MKCLMTYHWEFKHLLDKFSGLLLDVTVINFDLEMFKFYIKYNFGSQILKKSLLDHAVTT